MDIITILVVELAAAILLYIVWAWTATTFYEEGFKEGYKEGLKDAANK